MFSQKVINMLFSKISRTMVYVPVMFILDLFITYGNASELHYTFEMISARHWSTTVASSSKTTDNVSVAKGSNSCKLDRQLPLYVKTASTILHWLIIYREDILPHSWRLILWNVKKAIYLTRPRISKWSKDQHNCLTPLFDSSFSNILG